VEAFLALLFALTAFSLLLPSFSARPSFLNVFKLQLTQDFMEVSVKNPDTLQAIRDFAGGSEQAKDFLEGKYSALLSQTGDYCIELEARGRGLRVNCVRPSVSKITVSRIVFDGTGEGGFFELTLSLGFHS